MTITRKLIEQMRSHGRMRIDAALEELILAEYGVEPEPFEYTAQDLHEQIRKLINQYTDEHPDPNLVDNPRPWRRNDSTSQAPTTQRGAKISNSSNK